MYKSIIVLVLLATSFAGHVRKTHKGVQTKRTFNSAFMEFVNLGEADYHLDAKVAQHWAQVESHYDEPKHTSFVETHAEYVPGVVGTATDLSHKAGVYQYTVTDYNGNVIESEEGDHLANKLNTAYLQMTQEIEKGPAMTKLQTDMDNIIREDQMEAEQKEEEQRKALEGTPLQEQ